MGGGILHPDHPPSVVSCQGGRQCPGLRVAPGWAAVSAAPHPVHTGRRELGHTLKALSALARSHRAGWLGPERAGGPLHGSARWPADEQKAVGHQPV